MSSRPGVDAQPVGSARPVVGIDVGGTTIKGLLRGPRGEQLAEDRRRTPAPDPTGQLVSDTVTAIAADLGHRWGDPLGVAVPGILDEASGTAIRSVNLSWNGVALRAALTQRCGPGVVLSHDVRAGAVAEARAGAAIHGVAAFVAIGTGIAAALLIDGEPLSSGGWSGEIGQLVLADGPFAGLRVEQVASASATAARAGAPDGWTVATRVSAGDRAAQMVWNDTIDVLGQSLASLVAVIAPSTIIIGGGLARSGDLLLTPLRRRVAALVPGLRTPDLVLATLGDTAAAHGAALFAQDQAEPRCSWRTR